MQAETPRLGGWRLQEHGFARASALAPHSEAASFLREHEAQRQIDREAYHSEQRDIFGPWRPANPTVYERDK
jgi:hypothetical protein